MSWPWFVLSRSSIFNSEGTRINSWASPPAIGIRSTTLELDARSVLAVAMCWPSRDRWMFPRKDRRISSVSLPVARSCLIKAITPSRPS